MYSFGKIIVLFFHKSPAIIRPLHQFTYTHVHIEIEEIKEKINVIPIDKNILSGSRSEAGWSGASQKSGRSKALLVTVNRFLINRFNQQVK